MSDGCDSGRAAPRGRFACRPWRRLAALLAVAVAGCGAFTGGTPSFTENVHLVAVYPIREAPPAEVGDGDRPVLDTHAGRAVTAQLYAILTEQSRYRFVPDLRVEELVADIGAIDPVEGARELAQLSNADAVMFGAVYRFQDRIGPRLAASAPASVSFELALYLAETDEVVWRGQFDETQEALTSNFFDAWMFWQVGPHWFSSRELARVGVEKLIDELR